MCGLEGPAINLAMSSAVYTPSIKLPCLPQPDIDKGNNKYVRAETRNHLRPSIILARTTSVPCTYAEWSKVALFKQLKPTTHQSKQDDSKLFYILRSTVLAARFPPPACRSNGSIYNDKNARRSEGVQKRFDCHLGEKLPVIRRDNPTRVYYG